MKDEGKSQEQSVAIALNKAGKSKKQESVSSLRDLGLRILDWHAGQTDPLYAIGSSLAAGREDILRNTELVNDAIYNLNLGTEEEKALANELSEITGETESDMQADQPYFSDELHRPYREAFSVNVPRNHKAYIDSLYDSSKIVTDEDEDLEPVSLEDEGEEMQEKSTRIKSIFVESTRTVADMGDEYQLVTDSQDIEATLDSLGKGHKHYDFLFVKLGSGDYDEVWGGHGTPRFDATVEDVMADDDEFEPGSPEENYWPGDADWVEYRSRDNLGEKTSTRFKKGIFAEGEGWVTENYVIPEWAATIIEYGGDDHRAYHGSNGEADVRAVEDFLAGLPQGGSWEYSDESFFSRTNDITDLGDTCIDAKYTYKKEFSEATIAIKPKAKGGFEISRKGDPKVTSAADRDKAMKKAKDMHRAEAKRVAPPEKFDKKNVEGMMQESLLKRYTRYF